MEDKDSDLDRLMAFLSNLDNDADITCRSIGGVAGHIDILIHHELPNSPEYSIPVWSFNFYPDGKFNCIIVGECRKEACNEHSGYHMPFTDEERESFD